MKVLSLLITIIFFSEVFAQRDFSVGERFPDIKLPALSDGRLTSLTDYLGQKVVLHIFASW